MNKTASITAKLTLRGIKPRPGQWWIRLRSSERMEIFPSMGGSRVVAEFYVPWWAWPMEIIHRAAFGTPSRF